MISPQQPIVTRKEAKRLGLKKYFTGAPCVRGHTAMRLTSTKNCTACIWEDGQKRTQERRALYKRKPRTEARNAGEMYYFTGTPCPRGHVTLRRTSTAQCTECVRDAVGIYRHSDSSRPAYIASLKASSHKRRAWIAGSGGFFTPNDIADIRRMQKDRCAEPTCRCKLRGKGHIDHIVPLKRGGSNGRRNLQLLCGPCNMRKHAKDPLDFARELGRLL